MASGMAANNAAMAPGQNIGARRLCTVMEMVMEDLSFEAPDLPGRTVPVDGRYVREKLVAILQSEDLRRFIL